ncbi:MAG: hypothetical protein GPJ54_04070 [Candidatus Heimdallarchaeota archaeon]|nr:hypothetical protein [Candidatus Heimdallarchaeota archaeon]
MLSVEAKEKNYLEDIKDYFISSGYDVGSPSGRGVYAEFILKKGKTKRDPVEVIDVKTDPVGIRISQLTNEKRYIFKIGSIFYTMRGKTLEKSLVRTLIYVDKIIEKSKRINVNSSWY